VNFSTLPLNPRVRQFWSMVATNKRAAVRRAIIGVFRETIASGGTLARAAYQKMVQGEWSRVARACHLPAWGHVSATSFPWLAKNQSAIKQENLEQERKLHEPQEKPLF
jgi:hypothetical protein